MQLEQRFMIPVGLGEAWDLLLDVERVAPCFPGATLEEVNGNAVKGGVRVKLGPVLLNYRGVATFLERDEASRRVVVDAKGNDTKGGSSAAARVVLLLTPLGDASTECVIATDLNVTGRPAQFGRGIMNDVATKITAHFAGNLSAMLTTPQPAADEPTVDEPAQVDSPVAPSQPLDLLGVAGPATVKRFAPVAAAACLLLILVRTCRKRSSSRPAS